MKTGVAIVGASGYGSRELMRILINHPGAKVVMATSRSDEAPRVDALHPALVLMDINMPEMNGIEANRRILAAHPDVVVFLCSTYDVADLPPAAANSGAAAYVNKEQFGADMLRRLWAERSSGSFAVS